MKTITLSDEDFTKVQGVLSKAETNVEPKKKTVIYKTDGSVLYESDKETVKEAVREMNDLSEADLSEADLRGANLYGANLYGADLRGADLSEAEFQYAKFYGKGGATKIKQSQVNDLFKALGIIVEN